MASVLAQDSTGREILTAESGEDALRHLGRVDLVVADHRMPGMTGVELLTRVREEHPEVVRVLVTAYADLDVAIAALERAEVHYYLRKPWDASEIQSLIASALARSTAGMA